MKMAMFSPLPPKETGIALYTQNLAELLKQSFTIDLFDTDTPLDNFKGMKVIDYKYHISSLTSLHHYDLLVYHVGNNHHFHLSLYHVLQQNPGIVILHDAVIYYLIAGQDINSFIRDFSVNYGVSRIKEVSSIIQQYGHPLSYCEPQRYPLLKTVLNNATAVIVHSQTAKNLILSYDYKKEIFVIPFQIYRESMEKSNSIKNFDKCRFVEVNNGELLIACFGFMGPTKRLPIILAALAKIKNVINFKFMVVGSTFDTAIQQLIEEYHLQEHVIRVGYLSSEDDFFGLMSSCDIVINLRYPSMGETSSIVIQAMHLGKACIVTDHGWLSELPDNSVIKIPFDESEIDQLVSALTLLNNKPQRDMISTNAKTYVAENCHPDKITELYCNILNRLVV